MVALAIIAASATSAYADVALSVSRTEFNVHENGRRLAPEEIVGLELSVGDAAGNIADFRVEGTWIDPTDPEIRLYDVSVKDKQTGEWRRFCRPGPDALRWRFHLPACGHRVAVTKTSPHSF